MAQITTNRVKTGKWGDSICEVVKSPNQFSWTSRKKEPPSGKLWEESKIAVDMFLKGERLASLEDSLHYHNRSVRPSWAKKKNIVARIDSHIFYKLE